MRNRRQHYLRVRSRNFSNAELKRIPTPCVAIYRMGSTTPTEEITSVARHIEINSPEGCGISANKILMKQKFDEAEVRTPKWFHTDDNDLENFKNSIKDKMREWEGDAIVKRFNSSKGVGIHLINDDDSLNSFIELLRRRNDNPENYIVERFSTYNKEYRLHITKDGCFYACRKMLKNDAGVRWHRHDNNSVWIVESNPLFNRPNNWDAIVEDCVKALNAVGLDIAAFDIKVQSKLDSPKWLILECNSAPGLGEVGLEKYKEVLPEIINNKYQELINNE